MFLLIPDDPKLFDISSPESQRSSGYLSPSKDIPPITQPRLGMYTKQPWAPNMNSTRNYRPSHSQLNLNRNLNVRHSVHLDSVSSSVTDSNPRSSWGSAYYGNILPMDYTGDSALHSFFDKTPVVYNMREDDDTCSTTTSGSYTIYSEEILWFVHILIACNLIQYTLWYLTVE